MKRITSASAILALSALTGCSSLFDNPTVPEGYQSPSSYHSPSGGLLMAKYAENLFIGQIAASIVDGGLFGDELANNANSSHDPTIDQRYIPESEAPSSTVGSYSTLQRMRGQASMARGILERFAPKFSPAIRGKLFVIDGYARIFLADQYCSGVPLSTMDFDGDYTLKPGSSLIETYESAITMFDSALSVSSDSANVEFLATIGKARALVGAGRLKDANDLVSGIETRQTYVTHLSFFEVSGTNNRLVARATVTDNEGGNGFSYISSRDPRTRVASVQMLAQRFVAGSSKTLNYPTKYATTDTFSYTLASGIEARLIEAEYQLSLGSGNGWLTILNTLRTTGDIVRIDSSTPGVKDTIWTAGTGGVEGLKLLEDPGTPDARLDLLFRERAFWLFMTGNRMPDMRRLVRQYGRSKDEVFPVGVYLHGPSVLGEYGSDINMPIPWSEKRNKYYTGCMNRDQ